jgi:hypothetical protein
MIISIMGGVLLTGCGSPESKPNNTTTAKASPTPDLPYATAPLPENGYKAKITLLEPPTKLRAGEKVTIRVKAQNASDVPWKVRGGGDDNRLYIGAGDRWLTADGTLITAMDGRRGLDRNLKPGEETEVPLLITAPKDPGDYILEVDLVQEQVAWFHDKGSPTAKTKISVVK